MENTDRFSDGFGLDFGDDFLSTLTDIGESRGVAGYASSSTTYSVQPQFDMPEYGFPRWMYPLSLGSGASTAATEDSTASRRESFPEAQGPRPPYYTQVHFTAHDVTHMGGWADEPGDGFTGNAPPPARAGSNRRGVGDAQDRPYACDSCKARSRTKADLQHHQRRVHILGPQHMRPHGCPACGRRFVDPNKLKRHFNDRHSQWPNGEACRVCGRLFTRQDALKRHVLAKHEQSSTASID